MATAVGNLFSSLKPIRRRACETRRAVQQDDFDHIEGFYNPVPKHVRNGMVSHVGFEQQQFMKAEGV